MGLSWIYHFRVSSCQSSPSFRAPKLCICSMLMEADCTDTTCWLYMYHGYTMHKGSRIQYSLRELRHGSGENAGEVHFSLAGLCELERWMKLCIAQRGYSWFLNLYPLTGLTIGLARSIMICENAY